MALPSRRAILSSSALHGAVLVAFAVFGAAAAARRPHADIRIRESVAAPPPAAPAAPPVVAVREPVDVQQPIEQVEVVEPIEPAATERPVPEAPEALPRCVEPTLERVVHRVPQHAAPPVETPPEQEAEAVAPPAPPSPAESSPEQSAQVVAVPRSDNRPPDYPSEARRRGQEGEVLLDVHVDERGVVRSVVVAVTSGSYLLDRAAVRAVARWRFEPARADGVAIATDTRVAVDFRIDG